MRRLRPDAARAHADDDRREQRLDEIRTTVERFVYDLASLSAGHRTAFERSAAPGVAAAISAAMKAFLASGDVMRPDFGAYGELRVEGDLLDAAQPVPVWLEFEDRSMRQRDDGRLVAAPRRRTRLALRVSGRPCRVVACAVERGEPA